MNKTTIVVILLLFSNSVFASSLTHNINSIESEWANIYYGKNSSEQKLAYPKLITRIQLISKKHPRSADLIIWRAITISTNAAFENPFKALASINKAKSLLEQALLINHRALDGAAYVALGTLYYMAPGWPISFGNTDRANQLLKKALEINPKGIDPNYFYADYLLSKNKVKEASIYFKLALNAPIRSEQQFADTQLKNEAQLALKTTSLRKVDSGKNRFWSLFSSAKSN